MEMVSKPCQVDLSTPNPGSVNTVFEKQENTGSQMGHTKKYFVLFFKLKKQALDTFLSKSNFLIKEKFDFRKLVQQQRL